VVFDMPDSSDMVPFGEPFFIALDAEVEVVPVMNAEDCRRDSASSADQARIRG